MNSTLWWIAIVVAWIDLVFGLISRQPAVAGTGGVGLCWVYWQLALGVRQANVQWHAQPEVL